MRFSAFVFGLSLAWSLAAQPFPTKKEQTAKQKQKEQKEEITQTLATLPDPPSTMVVETGRLVFHLAPLSGKGLLSKQVDEALKAINKQAKGAAIVKLRAFVAGTGDMRRVTAIAVEDFTKKRKALPIISVVRIGLLPLNGAQVVLEGVSVSKKVVNPNGLVFISGQAAREPADPSAPKLQLAGVAGKSVDMLRAALAIHGLAPADALRLTCFNSSLDDNDAVRQQIAGAFPAAVLNIVQVQRVAADRMVECEAVARLKAKPAQPVRIDNPTNATFARSAVVASDRILLSSVQMAFGAEDADVRLAFTRLRTTLTAANTSLDKVFYLTAYPTTAKMLDRFRALRFEFLDRAKAPASTNLAFEGLPSLDASLGMEVIATLQ